MGTIIENLKELKDHLKESAKIVAHEFTAKVSDVYDKLSTQVDDILGVAADKKDEGLEKLKEERDAINSAMEDYKDLSVDKADELHSDMVDRLQSLNDKIKHYNDSKKSL